MRHAPAMAVRAGERVRVVHLPICEPERAGVAGSALRVEGPAGLGEGGAGLKIGDLARLTGKTTRALRLYEEMGLLTPDTRSDGGFRLYDAQAAVRVQWISQLQELGFSLHEIQDIVLGAAGHGVPREAMARVRGHFTTKLRDVADQIQRLQTLQGELARSLAYLESCQGCSASESTRVPAARVCASCADHGDEPTPSLIQGLTVARLGHEARAAPSVAALPPDAPPPASRPGPLTRGRNS